MAKEDAEKPEINVEIGGLVKFDKGKAKVLNVYQNSICVEYFDEEADKTARTVLNTKEFKKS
jgi:hypothetical protein